nr:hypothetical protein [Eubacterium sp.]
CPECGKELSDKAAACPSCGCPIEEIMAQLEKNESERKEKEEARKNVDPKVKRKKITTIIISVAIVALAVIGFWLFGIKIPRDKAYKEYAKEVVSYNSVIANYNETVNKYNEVAGKAISANEAFDEVIGSAQELVDSDEISYYEDALSTLTDGIKDAKDSKIQSPELKAVVTDIQEDTKLKKAKVSVIKTETQKISEQKTTYANDTETIKLEIEKIEIPDYSEAITKLSEQSKALEESYAIQRQITAPSEEWVLARLGRVEEVAKMAPVTEDNDPNGQLNKAGGYTSTVYFSTSLLGTQKISGDKLIDEGTVAGGAVETYRTIEDAQDRDLYLSGFDGTAFASGSHMVLGTMVIRTSDNLKASQQEALTNAIVEAMISLNDEDVVPTEKIQEEEEEPVDPYAGLSNNEKLCKQLADAIEKAAAAEDACREAMQSFDYKPYIEGDYGSIYCKYKGGDVFDSTLKEQMGVSSLEQLKDRVETDIDKNNIDIRYNWESDTSVVVYIEDKTTGQVIAGTKLF